MQRRRLIDRGRQQIQHRFRRAPFPPRSFTTSCTTSQTTNIVLLSVCAYPLLSTLWSLLYCIDPSRLAVLRDYSSNLSPPWYAPPRKTQTKKRNMAYITEVEYEYHGAAECSDRQPRHATLSTPVLRMKKPHIKAGSRVEFWSDACSCPRAFISQKAVSPNNAADRNSFSIPWSSHVHRPIDRTVLISDCFFERSSHVMGFDGYDPQSGPLVLVFWSDPLGSGAGESLDMGRWRRCQLGQLFMGVVKTRRQPMEFILVNAEQIAGRCLGLADDLPDLCERVSQDHITRYTKALDDISGSYLDLAFSPQEQMDHFESARSTKFTFVTMKDYLTNWDWKGEFTDEQIKPWLEALKQDRDGE
jgi:hypothetical protein